jgi:aminoglycoside phosphotransferase (APT) family kinase protein
VPEWTAEIEVDARLARRLIYGQFPSLAVESLEPFDEGWDNAVWLVNGSILFRFPRRAIAVAGVSREVEVLPVLAPLLPVAIPLVAYAGVPTEEFPWPFFGTPLLGGREVAAAGLSDSGRNRLARPLAMFLRALHAPSVAQALAGHRLPEDPHARADMSRRVARTRRQLAEVERLGLWTPDPAVAGWLEEAEALGPAPVEVVVHGDLHFRHLLVPEAPLKAPDQSESGSLTGIIDWGDVCRGCRSIDVLLFWSLLPPAGRAEFLEVYGAISDDELLRARVLALSLNALLAVYGRETGLAHVEREAVAGLQRTRMPTD